MKTERKLNPEDYNASKSYKALSKAWWIFGFICFFVVAASIFLVVFYINTLQTIIGKNGSIPVQSSSDILNMSIPLLAVFAGFLVSFLGMKRFENIDIQLETMKKEIEDDYEKKLRELNASKQELENEYAKRFESLDRLKDRIGQEVKKEVALHIQNEGSTTISQIAEAKDNARQDIQQLEDSVLEFLNDYSWLIDNKEELDKIRASSIQELYVMVSNAFSSEDSAAISQTIAVVRRVIDGKELLGDPDHFHNLGAILAKRHYTKEAVGICELGLTHFPNNMDLISCLTLYNAEIGNFESAEDYAKRLHSYSRSVWNWRAFTFYIDYCNYLPGTEELMEATLECVNDYQKYLPREEKAFMAAYETYEKYGMHTEAINALIKADSLLDVSPQCSTRLAGYYLENGEYDLCIKAASKALVGNANEQAAVETGAIFGKRGLAKDAQILKKEMNNEDSSQEEIVSAIKDLNLAQELGYRFENISARILILAQLLDRATIDNN